MNTYLTRWLVACTFLCSLAINDNVLPIPTEKNNDFGVIEYNEIQKQVQVSIVDAMEVKKSESNLLIDEQTWDVYRFDNNDSREVVPGTFYGVATDQWFDEGRYGLQVDVDGSWYWACLNAACDVWGWQYYSAEGQSAIWNIDYDSTTQYRIMSYDNYADGGNTVYAVRTADDYVMAEQSADDTYSYYWLATVFTPESSSAPSACDDATACNNGLVGDCVYANDCGSCPTFDADGNSNNDADESCYGCTLAGAPNYDPDATTDDGSCSYYIGADYGYWVPAYAGYIMGCGTYYIYADSDGDGMPDNVGNGVCNDAGDVNGDGVNDGLNCEYFGLDGCDCGTQNTDPDGLCYDEAVSGCMDPDAPNYNADAEIDDGQCEKYPGATLCYWDSDGLVNGIDCRNYIIDCEAILGWCDCVDSFGSCTDCGYDDDGNWLGDGVPASVGNGSCTQGTTGGGTAYSLNCDAFGDDGCDCADYTDQNGDNFQIDDPNDYCYQAAAYGCTDVNANNHDANANINCTDADAQDCDVCDYSCQLNAYQVRMGDTYGDGWGGRVLTIGDLTFTGPQSGCESMCDGFFYDGDGTLDCQNPDGSGEECWATSEICLADGTYDVTMTGGGSFAYEAEFEIIDVTEGSFHENSVVLNYTSAPSNANYSGTLLAPVPEYVCGDGTCNDSTYTDVDGNDGTESCGLADDADACYVDCGQCPWLEDDGSDVTINISSYGTYYVNPDTDQSVPAIQWTWEPLTEGYSCSEIQADPSLDSCYTYTLAGYSCEYLSETLTYDCSLVQSCGLCWQPDACSDAGGNSSWKGDGFCNSDNNIEACGYDGGDCCACTCDASDFSNYDPASCGDTANGGGYTCVDPAVSADAECDCLALDDIAANDCEADPAQACADSGGFYCGEGQGASYVSDDCITNSAWLCDGANDCVNGLDEADTTQGGDCFALGNCYQSFMYDGTEHTCDTFATDYGVDCGTLWYQGTYLGNPSYPAADCGGCDCPLDTNGCNFTFSGGYTCDDYVAAGYTCEYLESQGFECSGCLCGDDALAGSGNPGGVAPDNQLQGESIEIFGYNSHDEDMLLISKVFGFDRVPLTGPYKNQSTTWTDLAMQKITLVSIKNMPKPTVINLETGEIIPGDSNGSRDISYRFQYGYTLSNGNFGTSSIFNTGGQSSFLVYGFTDLQEACGRAYGENSADEVTPWTDWNCTQAGLSDYADCDGAAIPQSSLTLLGNGVCNDSEGSNFACDEYDCDNGDCLDECGVCGGQGAIYDCGCSGYITCSDGTTQVCNEADCPGCSLPGDLNGDLVVNVLDVVGAVSLVLDSSAEYNDCVDLNNDGAMNVLDVVAMVSIVVGSGDGRLGDATSATMNIDGNTLNISGNGFIAAVQMTLSHGSDFSIDLTDDAMVADYRTNDNTTTLIVVAPNSDEIFTASGNFNVEEMIVANGNGVLDVTEIGSFTLSAAYPNPFNPSTSISLNMPTEGYVSVKAYNLVGQVVGVISEGNMNAGSYTMTWDASDLSSGVYLITAEYAGNVATQKVMLMK